MGQKIGRKNFAYIFVFLFRKNLRYILNFKKSQFASEMRSPESYKQRQQ